MELLTGKLHFHEMPDAPLQIEVRHPKGLMALFIIIFDSVFSMWTAENIIAELEKAQYSNNFLLNIPKIEIK